MQAAGPQDQRQIRPDAGVLMREHDDLRAVVGHVLGEIFVAIDHRAPEGFVTSGNR